MTKLQKAALARVPFTYDTVEDFWNGSHFWTAEKCLKLLCESHERLRMELEGVEKMLSEEPQDEPEA